ncbi:hypothetical protein EYF80_014136 [Liparis tanakae]|uniref:Uncharacterized protein n=1 Tax=Liparis tanakae TaxID=230148 RepID=A0A4Z2IC60_9TELE|nr:hypothetical protein EYF80_014136 [Liparis tanakae]
MRQTGSPCANLVKFIKIGTSIQGQLDGIADSLQPYLLAVGTQRNVIHKYFIVIEKHAIPWEFEAVPKGARGLDPEASRPLTVEQGSARTTEHVEQGSARVPTGHRKQMGPQKKGLGQLLGLCRVQLACFWRLLGLRRERQQELRHGCGMGFGTAAGTDMGCGTGEAAGTGVGCGTGVAAGTRRCPETAAGTRH